MRRNLPSPRPAAFPPPSPRRCYSALFEASPVLCSRPTPRSRACPSCLAAHVVDKAPGGVLRLHGVSDSARLLVRKPFARGGCCLLFNGTRSTPRNSTRFAAQYPARGIPCERFKLNLAVSPCITRGVGAAGEALPSLSWRTPPRSLFNPPSRHERVESRRTAFSTRKRTVP
jgi:hypothetical protein